MHFNKFLSFISLPFAPSGGGITELPKSEIKPLVTTCSIQVIGGYKRGIHKFDLSTDAGSQQAAALLQELKKEGTIYFQKNADGTDGAKINNFVPKPGDDVTAVPGVFAG